MRLSLKLRLQLFAKLTILIACLILLQSCSGDKARKQSFADTYLEIVKDLKNQARVDIIKKGSVAIIAYRKSGFMDVDNAERAKNSLLEGIKLDSIALERVKRVKAPDPKAEEIIKELMSGVGSVIKGNVIFASNYSKAKDQNLEERKETIINIRPGMRYLAEGLNSTVSSMDKMQEYIKYNNLKGSEDIARWYTAFKMESDNIRGFLKN
jgi:hypothetical protein